MKENLDIPIIELPVTIRLYNFLNQTGVRCVADIVKYSVDDLREMPGCGLKTCLEIQSVLKELGLSLADSKRILKPKIKRVYYCPMCDEPFRTKIHAQNHCPVKTHFMCVECELVYNVQADAENCCPIRRTKDRWYS